MNAGKWAFLGLLLAALPAGADVYKSVDKDGNIIFSDTPSENAEKVELDELPTIPALETGPPGAPPPSRGGVPPDYTELEIVNPANDAALRLEEDDATIPVSVRLAPALFPAHSLVLYLDGNEYATGRSPGFQLTGVERGTHQLRVAVKNSADGQIIKSSPTSTFHLLAHSKLHTPPTVGKPPAKPK